MRLRARMGLILLATLIAGAVTVVLVIRHSVFVLDTPRPLVRPEALDSLPQLPPSIVEAPITYDLKTMVDSLEAAVPLTYGDIDLKLPTRRPRMSVAFVVSRSRFKVSMKGQTARISAQIQYSGRLWYDPPIGPEVVVSCGLGDDPPRRAVLTVESTGELTRGWELRTKSRVVHLEAFSDSACDRCRVSFLRIDGTQHVLSASRMVLDEKLAAFDGKVSRWPVRQRFEKVWRVLQRPMRLADSVYLTINPTEAQLGTIGAVGDSAYANLRLFGQPRVTTGPRPRLAHVPLPPLERANDIGRGARVLMDASFAYPIASVMLRKVLVGRRLEQGGRLVTIRDVAISGVGGGRVALGIQIGGAVRGRLFFTGTPAFDSVTHEITVPDLNYDIGTAQVLVNSYEWLADVSLRDLLRAQARIPDSTVVNHLAQLAERGINRKLPARGTSLSGAVGNAGVIEVRATLKDIRVRAVADADLKLSIRRSPSIPRFPDSPPAPDEDAEDDSGDEAAWRDTNK